MTSCMSNPKKLSVGREDRISNLPSEIIDHILDYLPVHDAARTSILSRKWRNCWPMHQKLIFDQGSLSLKSTGMLRLPVRGIDKIITSILLQHTGTVVEFLLDLSFIKEKRFSQVDQWMGFLSKNGVKKLSLMDTNLAKPYRLASCVFSCSSLKYLSLCGVRTRLFSSGSLDNLTYLFFKDVVFEPNLSNVSYTLSTPKLKQLFFFSCMGIQHVHIASPSLNELTIDFSCDARWNCFLSPNLKKFKFILWKEVPKEHRFNLSKLLKKLPKISDLHLDHFALKFLNADGTSTMLPITANSLVHLTLDFVDSTDLGQISAVIWLLQSCPNLCILDIQVSSRFKDNGERQVEHYLKTLRSKNHYFHNLKTVKIYLYSVSAPELMLLKLLLACSPSLDNFIVEEKFFINSTRSPRIAGELQGFFRASPNVNILYNKSALD